MKIGDYVRTRDGLDRLVSKIKDDNYDYYWYRFGNGKTMTNPENDFVKKSSSNIIDLIEVGDYVNGYLVMELYTNEIRLLTENNVLCFLQNKDIKSIVTKEQFESMEYKVGE